MRVTTRTATFAFCDMVGSTALLSAIGLEASEGVQRRYFSALREAIAARGVKR